jgi:hypothetical protein
MTTGGTIWLASYPKSGNTWLRAVYTAWQSGGALDLDAMAAGDIASSRELFEASLGIPSSDLTPAEIALLRPRVDELFVAGHPDPRPRKIHDALLPGAGGELVVSLDATRAAVYVVRDPRDVAVSLAHHHGRPLDWAVDRMSNPEARTSVAGDRLPDQLEQRLGTWSQHVRSWVDEAPFPIEVVRYEDCASDPVPTFARALAAIAGEPADHPDVERAVELARFDRLRSAEEAQGFRARPHTATRFFRRGEAGSWHDELPRDLAERIAGDHAEVMARFGYSSG